MIVRRQLRVHLVIFALWRPILILCAMGLGVSFLHEAVGWTHFAIPFHAVAAMGTALAILLAFRNNSAYDRWWEARKLWGQLLNSSRIFARQVTTLLIPLQPEESDEVHRLQREMLYRHLAYVNALRTHLRGQTLEGAYVDGLGPTEKSDVTVSSNPPFKLVQWQAENLKRSLQRGWISEFRLLQIDSTLNDLMNVQGGCERIKNTPLPRLYDFTLRIFLIFYAVILPLGLVGELGWGTVLLSFPISILFRSLDSIGRVHEDPFENRIGDIPMTALCRTIEIGLKEALNESERPAPLTPVDGILM